MKQFKANEWRKIIKNSNTRIKKGLPAFTSLEIGRARDVRSCVIGELEQAQGKDQYYADDFSQNGWNLAGKFTLDIRTQNPKAALESLLGIEKAWNSTRFQNRLKKYQFLTKHGLESTKDR